MVEQMNAKNRDAADGAKRANPAAQRPMILFQEVLLAFRCDYCGASRRGLCIPITMAPSGFLPKPRI